VDRHLGQHVALLGAVGVVFALILNLLLSLLVNEPRPFVSYPGVVHVLIPHIIDNSYPSDHEAVIGAVTTALGLYVLFLIKATVAVSGEVLRTVLSLMFLAGAWTLALRAIGVHITKVLTFRVGS
jgi:hypothetical protein